ncbi:MAG: penicillin acylase family protein, partial [Haliea sp.]
FQLQLNPDNPAEYLHQGRYHPLQRKLETIHVKGADSHDLVIYRSHYGAIVDYRPEEHVAYAKTRGWEGEEINTLMAWNKLGKARNHQQWLDRVQPSAINVNWYYADAKGNIGYVMGGRYPQRAAGHDGRTPVPGTGEYDWQGFMPFDTNPQIFNPSTGYIANWNQRPAEGVPNPDMWWYAWHEADRISSLSSRLEAREKMTAEEAWDLMMEVSFEDPNARFYVPRLIRALETTEQSPMRQARDILASWNYLDLDDDRNGYYDHPATAIFRHWQYQLIELILKDYLPEEFVSWFISTGHPQPGEGSSSHNLSVAGKVIHRMLAKHDKGEVLDFDLLQGRDPDDLMREAMARTLAQLSEDQGTDMASWHHPVSHTIYSYKNFLQIPQAGEDETMLNHLAMNRGTENNMTVFSADGVIGYEVAGPGQSGFIAADGTRSPHYDDQLELFGKLDKKRTWLNRSDIEQAARSRIQLQLK